MAPKKGPAGKKNPPVKKSPSTRKQSPGKLSSKKTPAGQEVVIRSCAGPFWTSEVRASNGNAGFLRHLQDAQDEGVDQEVQDMNICAIVPKRQSHRNNSVTTNATNSHWKSVMVFVRDEDDDTPEERECAADALSQARNICCIICYS